MQGSNELNMLLKAKVVKLKVELDYKGSKLPAQVDGISEKLKNKPVKLKVKLDLTVKDLNTQLNALHTKMNNSKTAKAPIKLAVQLDVKGSAKEIQRQLKEVYKTVEDFNKKYGKQIAEMQQKAQQVGKGASSSIGGAMPISNNVSSYMNSLKDAEKYMKSTFGKGLFTSQEMKNANGELLGFVGSLTKANGVVQKIRYEWDANKSTFSPISQQTLTQTEKSVKKALDSLRSLDKEIMTLGKNQGKYWKESNSLYNASASGKLTQDAVDSLKRRIQDEQALEKGILRENTLLREQKELIAQINRERKNMKNVQSKQDLGNLRNTLNGIDVNDSMSKNQIADIRSQFNSIKSSYDSQIKKEKELVNVAQKRLDVMAEISRIQRTSVLSDGKGAFSSRFLQETQYLAKNMKSMEQYIAVKKRMDATNREQKNVKISNDITLQLEKLKKAMFAYATATGRSQKTIEDRFAGVAHAVGKNLALATGEVKKWERMLDNFNAKQALEQRRNSIVPISSDNHKKVSKLVNAKDTNALKQYVGELNKADVAMMKLSTNDKGVTRITAQFASAKKTAKEVVYEIDKVDKQLRQVAQNEVFNANRNLGVFEQLKIAMARVPVWMMAMTAFYGSIRVVKNMTDEILKLDKALTELRRVADAQINIDHIFQGAIDLSKELGNNIHDVMQSVNDLARTFGQFNERQLLAIAKTGTLMSNVSDLNAQEATESLVGTMNAFNITAEDSIRIVDSLNEVDNNYAISTKQLATGLAKSASTSKTFGVTLEENIGHITAIGAVTMESGNIIGNSLKTIYSRITTMQGAEDALSAVGVAITKIGTGEVREVNDILGDLAGKWATLSDAERQNIAVKVAGRYQLSRFLALMNNYKMASEATHTALNSEGSAMRENAQYMKSYEARINQLKNSFTELSSSIGDAFLSAGLSTAINTFTKLAEVAVNVVDKFGAMPIVAGAIGILLLKFKVFDATILRMVYGMQAVGRAFTTTAVQSNILSTSLARTRAVGMLTMTSLRTGFVTMATTARTAFASVATASNLMFGGAFLLITAVFIGIGKAIEYFTNKVEDARLKQEELVKLNDKMVSSYRATGDGMQNMIDRYEELTDKLERVKDISKLSSEEQEELNLLTRQFAEQLPTTVEYIDANGEAHLRSVDAIKEEIKAVAELSKQKAILKTIQFEKNMKEETKSYFELSKELDKLIVKRDKLKAQDGKTTMSRDANSRGAMQTADNTEKIQLTTVEIMMQQAQIRESLQSTIKAIQEQALAYFEANGQLIGLGDSQMKLVEDSMSYNDSLLRNAKNEADRNQAYMTLYQTGEKVGSVFSEAFEIMTKGLEGQPDKISQIRDELGMTAQAIPKDFLKIDDTDIVGSTNRIVDGLKEIINVSTHVSAGSTDLDGLISRLEKTGMASDVAGDFVYELANQYNNIPLKADAMRRGIDGVTDSLEAQTEAIIDTIDVNSKLFGYGSEDLDAMMSQMQYLEQLTVLKGDDAKATMEWKASIGQLSEFLGVSESEVEKNIHQYTIMIGALKNLKIHTDEHGNSLFDLSEETSGLTKVQIEAVKAWIEKGGDLDFITGKYKDLTTTLGTAKDGMDDLKDTSNEPFKPMENPIDDNFVKNIFNSIGAVKDAQGTVLDSMKTASQAVSDVNNAGKNLGKIKEDVDNVGNSADNSKDKTIDFSSTMAKTFEETSRTVNSRSDSMITKHDSQNTAIKKIGDSAKLTRQDLINMNTTAQNTMNTLGKVASASRNASASNVSFGNANISSYNGVSESVASSINAYSNSINSAFSATSGEGGDTTGTGGGDGTSGVIRQPLFNPFTALHAVGGVKWYSGETTSSSSSSKAKTSTSKASKSTATKKATAKEIKSTAEELAELYVVDMLERKKTSYQGTLGQIEAKMSSLTKGTTQYRDAIRSTLVYENALFGVATKSLANTIARNSAIEKQLKKLGDTSKHNKAQREEYNKLQQEYDSNLSKIAGLKSEVENYITTIRDKSTEVFTDFIDEIIGKYDKAINTIKDRISNLDFRMEVLELTEPDNVKEQLVLNAEKAKELTKERYEYSKSILELEKQFNAEMKANPNSDKTKYVKEKLDEARDAYQSLTLDILRTEKAIKDIRAEVADEGIKQLKDYYGKMKDMATKAIDSEMDALKKAHDKKMEMYDDEIQKINDIYDAKIKSIDDEASQESYEEELASKNAERDATQAKIDALSFSANSGSLEDKKKVAELQKQLEEQNKDIDKFMKERHRDLLKEQLQEQQKQQVEALESKKKAEEDALETVIDRLEAEKEAVASHYDAIIDNEKYWADMRDKFIKGNFAVLTTELGKMDKTLQDMDKGVFTSLTESFTTFSEQVKKQIAEINALAVQNSIFNLNGVMSSANQVSQTKYDMTNADASSTGIASGLGELTITKPINLWKRVGNELEFEKILPTGGKYKVYGYDDKFGGQYNVGGGYWVTNMPEHVKYKKFDTGGYTGDDEGLAYLHKKEIVLKDTDTKNLLDTIKILDKVKDVVPQIATSAIPMKLIEKIIGVSNSKDNTIEYKVEVNIGNMVGNEDSANKVASVIMKELRKTGK